MDLWGFNVTADNFNTVAAGLGALFVGLSALVVTPWLNHRSNKKNREQVAQIAEATALALRTQGEKTDAVAQKTNEIKVSIDGRMDELLDMTRELAKARAEAVAETAARALRQSNVVSEVAGAIVERVGVAIDKAALTAPGAPMEQKPGAAVGP